MNSHPGDTIVRYLTTVSDRVMRVSPQCASPQYVFVADTAEGETITCCCVCSRVLTRIPSDTDARIVVDVHQ
jgi:hypothetical protein